MARLAGREYTRSPQTDHGLRLAAEALQWDGEVLGGVTYFGTTMSVVVMIDRDAHARRQELGVARPIVDADTLAMWEWPDCQGAFPPTVLSIVGVLSHCGHDVEDRVRTARKWRGFTASAVVVANERAMTEDMRLECAYSGIGVVSQHLERADVVLVGSAGRRAPARRTTVDRWLEEQLYRQVLARPDLADALL
jgi:hypothetical protein